jgi:hypothetical protein
VSKPRTDLVFSDRIAARRTMPAAGANATAVQKRRVVRLVRDRGGLWPS